MEKDHRCKAMPADVSVSKFLNLPWKLVKADGNGGQYINITHCPFCGREL